MKVIIQRWQPNANRYRAQTFELEEPSHSEKEFDNRTQAFGGGETFLGIDFDARQRATPGFKNFRTQHVDRVEVNSLDGTIEIYCSPIVERKYERKSPSIGAKIERNKIAESVYTPLPSFANNLLIEKPCFKCELEHCDVLQCDCECHKPDAPRRE